MTGHTSMKIYTLDAQMFKRMVTAGTANLRYHAKSVNDLNVFPIPDGDTGDNMLLTMQGGAAVDTDGTESIGLAARMVADGMLLSARGNSGVILSQLFDGIAAGLDRVAQAGIGELARAMREGVAHAYRAVMEPAEGTILTVAREASEYAIASGAESVNELLCAFLEEAERSLARTPELLEVLRRAGVVDSGGAGLIRIAEGARMLLDRADGNGSSDPELEIGIGEGALSFGSDGASDAAGSGHGKVDVSRFTEDSVLEYGYCTEVLLRLQNAKTDVAGFDVGVIREHLAGIGDSVVTFKAGSAVKIHVHTKTPEAVLEYCHRFGEFLTVKIENMSLQHNSLEAEPLTVSATDERKPYGVVAVACGEGIREMFRSLGADYVVDGGQSMNPSTADFIDAFKKVNADTILVLPNNGNVILSARQAAGMYKASDVRVLDSRNIGEGHAAITMLDTSSGDTERILAELRQAMVGVTTAAVSTCSRDTQADGLSLYRGEYIGFVGDNVLSADNDRADTACRLLDGIDFANREVCIVICGRDADSRETDAIREHISATHPGCEVYVCEGGQDIYHYIFIIE